MSMEYSQSLQSGVERLSLEEENELALRKDKASRQKLIESLTVNVVLPLVNVHCKKSGLHGYREDFISCGVIGLYEALPTWDPERAGIRRYAEYHVRRHLTQATAGICAGPFNMSYQQHLSAKNVGFTAKTVDIDSISHKIPELDRREAIDTTIAVEQLINKSFSEKHAQNKEVLLRHLGLCGRKPQTFQEIANDLRCTKQNVHVKYEIAVKILKAKIEPNRAEWMESLSEIF